MSPETVPVVPPSPSCNVAPPSTVVGPAYVLVPVSPRTPLSSVMAPEPVMPVA